LLAFPGKVMVDENGGRLFIADSNHHRIVIADLETYEVLDVIGTGQRGYVEGDFATVQFNQPQGMALDGDILYVADTYNHAIRALNLTDRTAEIIAGDGERGRGVPFFDTEISDPLNFAIRSPWDVTLGDDHILYIAMAGTHQIWQLNLDTNILQATVGDGREAMLNATLADSELAQPSGLYFTDGQLYFADSESSTVRVADLADDSVETIAGTTDNNLFDFGDIDGELGVSRLQHALGVTGSPDGLIYIADTYNSKIKVVDENFETQTLHGSGVGLSVVVHDESACGRVVARGA
jgi:sugar lactone lactonase YvrE